MKPIDAIEALSKLDPKDYPTHVRAAINAAVETAVKALETQLPHYSDKGRGEAAKEQSGG